MPTVTVGTVFFVPMRSMTQFTPVYQHTSQLVIGMPITAETLKANPVYAIEMKLAINDNFIVTLLELYGVSVKIDGE